MNVTQGLSYPIRFVYGSDTIGCAGFSAIVSPPSRLWTSDLSGVMSSPTNFSALTTWFSPTIKNISSSYKNGITYYLYDNYYNLDSSFFNTALPRISGKAQGITQLDFGVTSDTGTVYSSMAAGYFYATKTGTWNFRLTADDGAYLWLGSNAIRC
jgi:hypothetical protein